MRLDYVEVVAIDSASSRELPEEVIGDKSYVVAEAGIESVVRMLFICGGNVTRSVEMLWLAPRSVRSNEVFYSRL
jgi:hypothetical protein